MFRKLLNKKNVKSLIILIWLTLFLYSSSGEKGTLIENVAIPVGIAYDIIKISPVNHILTISMFAEGGKGAAHNISVESPSIAEVRQLVSLKEGKKVLYGFERVFVIGEREAAFGIENILDIWLTRTLINDRAYVAVSNGKACDIFMPNNASIENPGMYIEDLLKNANEYNFFSKKLTVTDTLINTSSEGRTLILPLIENKGEGPEIIGLSIFDGDKLMYKTDIDEAKFINLMSFNKVKGLLTLQKDSEAEANIYCRSNRRVKCYKEDNKYRFVIDLKLKGEIVSNEIYEDLNKNPESIKQFKKDVEELVLKNCNKYIDKIKGQYRIDVLSLGQTAAAKYGREKGIDWNKVISEADIKVNVKVEITKQGRGDY